MNFILVILLFILINSCNEGKEAVREADKIVKEYPQKLAEIPPRTHVLTEITAIRKSIKLYQIENNKYPEKLEDLSVKIKNMAEYEYNPESGEVRSKNYPEL